MVMKKDCIVYCIVYFVALVLSQMETNQTCFSYYVSMFYRNPHRVRVCVGDDEVLSRGHGVSAANQS